MKRRDDKDNKLSRRFFLKAGVITGTGSLFLGRSGFAKRRGRRGGRRKGNKRRKASNDVSGSHPAGVDSVVRFPGTTVTYTPFTQALTKPKILGFDTADPAAAIEYENEGIIAESNADPNGAIPLDPYPGAPDAQVGSAGVYHGIAPEYARQNPTHLVANINDNEEPPPPVPGESQKLSEAYSWDVFDDGDRNQEPCTRPNERNGEVHYAIEVRNSKHEWAPGVVTDILAYRDGGVPLDENTPPQNPDSESGLSVTGEFPAPTVLSRQGQPSVIRVANEIRFRPPEATGRDEPTETSLHLHGNHTPCHSDGFPDFYVLPFKKRDLYYPQCGPREFAEPVTEEGLSPIEIAEKGNLGPCPVSDLPTTLWYHEHGMDLTGYLVSQGLAGFYLVQDDVEIAMTTPDASGKRKLPSFYGPQDIPMAIMDQVIDLKEGILPYDFFDHNGRIGNVFSVNGKLQPYHKVGRGKYRFRLLNASNARYYHLALAPEDGSKLDFVQIGQDSWELDTAVSRSDVPLHMAQRVDAIVDFSRFENGDVIWLNNVLEQTNGRKAKGIDFENPTPLVKFIVDDSIEVEEVTVEAGDEIRPFTEIRDDEVVATRYFSFDRRNGAWQINNEFFSPRTSNIAPIANSTERWIFENKSGGWWHPIHIHLEAHQIQKFNGIPKRLPNGKLNPKFPAAYVNNVDVSTLEDNSRSEVLVKFRTFTGPFPFHCHNLEHEDMRMMH
ncbi:MAG: multicopper oxidase domain-containing protein, partial [Myxococcota bacterium]